MKEIIELTSAIEIKNLDDIAKKLKSNIFDSLNETKNDYLKPLEEKKKQEEQLIDQINNLTTDSKKTKITNN